MVDQDAGDEQADDLAALHELAARTDGTYEEQLNRWLDAGRAVLHADAALVALGAGFAITVVAVSGHRVAGAELGAELVDGRIHGAIDRGATLAVLPGEGPARAIAAVGVGPGPLAVSPLWIDGEAVGAVAFLVSPALSVLSAWQLALADVVADGIARIIEGEHRGPRNLVEGRSAVLESIARDEPVAVALRGACGLLAATSRGVRVVILRVTDDRLDLASEDAEDPWGDWFASQPVDFDSPFGQAVATGQPVLVADTAGDTRFRPDIVPDPSYRAMAVHPVCSTRRGHTLGLVVSLGSDIAHLGVTDEVGGAVLSLVEVALERELETERLAHQATHDPLTGVGNRAALLDRLQLVLARARRSARPVAVLFCDLNRFKSTNDDHGHLAGDAVLKEVAVRLRSAVRPSDTVSRTGGDEFVVVCEDLTDEHQAAEIAARIVDAVQATPVDIGDERLIDTSISVGVAMADPILDDPDRLLHMADLAMYDHKLRQRVDSEDSEPQGML